jgi:hypothetical protein
MVLGVYANFTIKEHVVSHTVRKCTIPYIFQKRTFQIDCKRLLHKCTNQQFSSRKTKTFFVKKGRQRGPEVRIGVCSTKKMKKMPGPSSEVFYRKTRRWHWKTTELCKDTFQYASALRLNSLLIFSINQGDLSFLGKLQSCDIVLPGKPASYFRTWRRESKSLWGFECCLE